MTNGTVLRSINNIYSVKTSDGQLYNCRIKGKKLEEAKGEYNPVVAGDKVDFEITGNGEGLVFHRQSRKSLFQRWNVKSLCNQVVCANMDFVVCVCSVQSPPFRPRFIDRVIACSRNVPVIICMNKCDILLTEEEFERFSLYGKLGYGIISVSAKTGENVNGLKKLLTGKTAAFVGQSGVGKSSLVNSLSGCSQRVGDVSEKYNRGRHTTNFAALLECEGFTLIDTPGFREISVPHDDPHLIEASFPEFREPSLHCRYDGCLHDTEPGCAVRLLVEKGEINADRYESYLRMLESLQERVPVWARMK